MDVPILERVLVPVVVLPLTPLDVRPVFWLSLFNDVVFPRPTDVRVPAIVRVPTEEERIPPTLPEERRPTDVLDPT